MRSVDRTGNTTKGERTLLETVREKVKFEAFGGEMLEKKSA